MAPRREDSASWSTKAMLWLGRSFVSALIGAAVTRATEVWPRLVAKCDDNAWAAGAALVVLLAFTIWSWWLLLALIETVFFSGTSSKLEGWSGAVDMVGAAVLCLLIAGIPIGLTALLLFFLFGSW